MNSIKLYLQSKPSLLLLLIISLVFPLVFYNLFSANFISWDDADYVTDNKDVHTFNLVHFFTHYYVGNYQPLVMLNYAIDWKLYGKLAFGYHIENVVWHFCNTILVFLLSKKLLKAHLPAFIIALVFAFHPMQIETIAWIAERKNVVYAFFFLLALLKYIQFLESKKIKFLIYTFICFIFSILSKPSAIVLPIVLFAIDYLYYNTFTKKTILQKTPFIIISIVLAIVTYTAQQQAKFINDNHSFAFYDSIGYAGYALMQYISKTILPFNLSVIYPYPQNKMVSVILGYVVIIALSFLIYYLLKNKKYLLLFGLSFFIINLLLVLQFVPFGEVLTADRYMYLPIIGIAIFIISLIKLNEKQFKITSICLIFILGASSFNRTRVWKNSVTLFTDILKKYPHSYVALNSIGAEYMLDKNYDLATRYLNSAINENVNYYKGYYNRGLLYAQTNRYDKALLDFNKAIVLNNYIKAYTARANIYYVLKDFSKAKADAEYVLTMEPTNAKANYVLATCYDDLNQLNMALNYYNTAISNQSEEPMYYMRRGILQGKLQHFDLCLADLNTCTSLNTKFAEAYYWKGVVKINLKQNPCSDLKTSLNLGFTAAQQPLYKYCN